jgi:hypothetical protein
VTGAITEDTLTAAPSPVVKEKLNVQSTVITGTVDVSSKRSFVISGYVNTSHGKVRTKVWQTVDFFNNQYYNYNFADNQYVENVSLGSSVLSTSTTSDDRGDTTVTSQSFNFPLTLDIDEFVASSGDTDVTTKATQTYESSVSTWKNNWPIYASFESNTGRHVDTIDYNTFLNTDQSAFQQYFSWDSTSAPYSCTLSASANVLTSFSPGCAQ